MLRKWWVSWKKISGQRWKTKGAQFLRDYHTKIITNSYIHKISSYWSYIWSEQNDKKKERKIGKRKIAQSHPLTNSSPPLITMHSVSAYPLNMIKMKIYISRAAAFVYHLHMVFRKGDKLRENIIFWICVVEFFNNLLFVLILLIWIYFIRMFRDLDLEYNFHCIPVKPS